MGQKLPDTFGARATWTRGKVRAEARLETDEDAQTDWLGEWTDDTGEDTIPRLSPAHHEYKRFRPCNKEYGAQDMQELEDLGQTWGMYGLVLTVAVQVYGQWVEVGHASVWSVGLYWGDRGASTVHVRELLSDLRSEAFSEARATIAAEVAA